MPRVVLMIIDFVCNRARKWVNTDAIDFFMPVIIPSELCPLIFSLTRKPQTVRLDLKR